LNESALLLFLSIKGRVQGAAATLEADQRVFPAGVLAHYFLVSIIGGIHVILLCHRTKNISGRGIVRFGWQDK
jgi:hypothetical protein